VIELAGQLNNQFFAFFMTSLRKPLRGIVTTLPVDRRSCKAFHRQIYDEFRRRILRGELTTGEIVPSTRQLAHDLRISRLPVLEAYAQLVAEGYFETRAGAGTFITRSLKLSETAMASRSTTALRAPQRISAGAKALPPYERPWWAERLGPFQVGQPELHDFPVNIWSRLVGRYARSMHVRDLQYGDPFGMPELRTAVATYLRTFRAVRCSPEQIMITSGSQQALDLCVRVLLDSGDQVWVEEPGYWLVKQVLTAAGCRRVPVAVDGEGLNVELGIRLAPRARAALVAPSHQYPLGVTMSVARRLKLLEWASAAAAWIIEDDYDSEYRYDSMPIASLQGLDQSDRVIYIGNFSKVMFPALRLGYVVVPIELRERFAAVRQTMDICPAHLNQATMADFIREGHFARHLRRMKPIYGKRRDVLVTELERYLSRCCQIVGSAAGMHLVLVTPARIDDVGIARKAASQSLWLSPLSASYAGTSAKSGFVLGFGNTKESRIPRAVQTLRHLLGQPA
jgi:GntR family transcriptional regulator/MocR family aminotransferase